MTTLPPTPPAPAPGPPPWQRVGPPSPNRWAIFASLVIALAAITLAIGCWFRPPPSSQAPFKPTYTDQQVTQAKSAVCAASSKVDHALDLADAEPVSSDRTEQLAVAALSRVTFEAGSRYLLTTLAKEPATPSDLATAVRNEADSLQELLVGFLNGIRNSDPAQEPAMNAANEARAKVQQLCK